MESSQWTALFLFALPKGRRGQGRELPPPGTRVDQAQAGTDEAVAERAREAGAERNKVEESERGERGVECGTGGVAQRS